MKKLFILDVLSWLPLNTVLTEVVKPALVEINVGVEPGSLLLSQWPV